MKGAASAFGQAAEMMEKQSRYDVPPEHYATVIRDLIRHENDLTNHRVMWLLIVQGFLANAYVVVSTHSDAASAIAMTGILLNLSGVVTLYKSYQAKGYLRFLGAKAKQGRLPEKYLPLDGWPLRRIKAWQTDAWYSSWFERPTHLLEPHILLPTFSTSIWLCSMVNRWSPLPGVADFCLSFLSAAALISLLLILLVSWQKRYEEEHPDEEPDEGKREQ